MNTQKIERRSGDELIRLSLMDGQVRVMMLETTQMCQRAADIHRSTPVCTAAMGRLMTATAMLGVMMKGENESVTVTVKGGGPIGTLVAVANHGDIKVCADNPQVELPLREDGKLNVGAAVGHDGRISVVKDLGLREPYIGQSELVSGELAVDFAHYFTISEQTPSLVALGVLVNGDVVLKAGGLLIQAMPGCEDATIDQLELRSPMFADISREMTFADKETLIEDWFRGMDPVLLEREPLRYHCACSRHRMEKALISLGRKELNTLIDEGTGAELGCHFCHSAYAFTTEDLKDLLAKASRD